MDAKEALRQLSSTIGSPATIHEAVDVALDALREKVAREEAAKPKRPTLEEIEAVLRNFGQSTAADLLKTLRERGGAVLTIWQRDTESAYSNAIALLRDLGVQPKEA